MKRSLVFLAIVMGLCLVPTITAVAGAQTDSAAQCDVWHVLLLLDQSGSLKGTDPDAVRVEASELLVDLLAATAGREGALSVGIAGFDGSYDPMGTHSMPSGKAAAKQEIQEFRDRNQGQNTDYVVALRGAAAYFAGIQAPAGCKTLLWFTDGAHDVARLDVGDSDTYTTTQDPTEITRELGSLICGPLLPSARIARPVVEDVRAAGMETRLIELRTRSADARTEELRRNTDPVLEALFTDGSPCRIEGSREEGSSADRVAELFFRQLQFAKGATEVACNRLSEGTLPVAALASVAFWNPAEASWSVRAGSQPLQSESGRAVDVALPVEIRRRGGPVVVDSTGITSCFVGLDARVQLPEKPIIYPRASEQTVDLTVTLPGEPKVEGFGSDDVSLDVQIGGQPANTSWDDIRKRWVVALPPLADATELTATATFTGLHTTPIVDAATFPIEVSPLPPPPSARWTGPTSSEGPDDVNGNVIFTSSATVPGSQLCVTVPAESLVLDERGERIGQFRLGDASRRCTPFTSGDAVDLPAVLDLDEEVNATGTVTIPYSSTFVDAAGVEHELPPGELTVNVVITKSPDTLLRTIVAALLALLSILVPLAALWIVTLYQSRLPKPDGLLVAQLPVSIRRGTAPALDLERELSMEDFHPVRGNRRRFDLPGGGVLERRFPRHPFARPTAELTYPGQRCATAHPTGGQASAGGAGLSAAFTHVVALTATPDTEAEGPAQAVLLVPRRTSAADATALLDEELPVAAARLVERSGEMPAVPGADGSGSSPPPDQPPGGGGDGNGVPSPPPAAPHPSPVGAQQSSPSSRKPPPAPGWL